MSLQIGPALKRGLTRLASRTGAILLAVYVAVYVLYQSAYNGIVASIYDSYGIPGGEQLQPTLGLPIEIEAGIVLACLIALTYVSVVAIRTFVADARDSFPDGALSGGIPWAVGNLFVGGFVLMVLYFVGLVLFVIPGLFVTVSFLFMAMYVADEGDNFVAGLRNSWGLATGNRLDIFFLLLVLVAIGGAFGFVGGSASTFVTLTDGPQSVFGLVLTVLIAPMSLYSLAVTTDAYSQLRESESDGPDTGTTSTETPSTPA